MKWLPILLIACSGAKESTESSTEASTEPTNEADSEPSTEETEVSLFLNEILAKSDTTADWVEIYNDGDAVADLSGYLLQDSARESWALPSGTEIEAGGYLLIWADDAAEEGLHAPFKFSKDGEVVTLLTPSGEVLDEVEFPELAAEESYARIEDGGDLWEIRTDITPGESNQ